MTNEFEENVFEAMDDLRGDNRVAVPDVGTIRRRAGKKQNRLRAAAGAACLSIIAVVGVGVWASINDSPATTETAGDEDLLQDDQDVAEALESVASDSAPTEIVGPSEINSKDSFGEWMLANRLRDDRTPFVALTASDSDPTTDGVKLHLSAYPLDGSFEFFAVAFAECGPPLQHGMIEFVDNKATFREGRFPDTEVVELGDVGYDCTPPDAEELDRALFKEFEIVPTASGLRFANDLGQVDFLLTDLEGNPRPNVSGVRQDPVVTETDTLDGPWPAEVEGALVMGRANWSSGYVQAQILHDLIEELGYEVTAPSEREFAPDLGYQAMATGHVDFWANSWYPGHLSWWEGDLPTGNRVADSLTRIDPPMAPDGGLQGWLVTKSWAEENGVTTIDQINEDPELWGQLDTDGDNKGEFYGCPEDWTCDNIMDAMAAFAEWNNLEQVQRGYDKMFDEFLAKAEAGQPAITYTWAPTDYHARAKVGETTMWISILDASVIDDSNPLYIDVPPYWCQRCEGTVGFKDLGSDFCLEGPDGCQLGWNAASIEITANSDWLAEYPDVHELFRQVTFSANELSQLVLEAERAGYSEEALQAASATWISENRAKVDSWLATAR